MLDRIRRLGSETAIYGVSTIVGRFLTFLLTPVYTHLLPTAELGIVATLYAYIALLNVVYGYGMESAYMRYVSTLEGGDRKQTFSVPFLSVGATGLLFSLLVAEFAQPVSAFVGLPGGAERLVLYAAAILLLDAAALIPFASLRMEHRAKSFATIKIAGILVNVGANIWFLLGEGMGAEGVFLAGVISSAVTLVLLSPVVIRNLSLTWNRPLYSELLRFGLPYLPAGLASMMIQVIDRPILESLKGPEAVGIYQANYRLGIFMMLLVSMYDFAWRPFFLSHATDSDAKPLFARVMTYGVLVGTAVFLVLSFFLGDFVRLPIFLGKSLIAAPYWGGLHIIPIVLLAYLFLGIYTTLIAGVYIEKKTILLPAVTGAGALANIAVNYALIPVLDLTGAALATLASYMLMAGLLFVLVQRFYPIQFEYKRLGKIALAGGVVYALALFLPSAWVGVSTRVVLLLLFFVFLLGMRFFTPSERAALRSLRRSRDSSP